MEAPFWHVSLNDTVGVILGSHTMDDDRWNVGTFAEPESCIQLKLKKGEAIIFNGRLVHCGGPGRETEAIDGFYTTKDITPAHIKATAFHIPS